MRYISRHWPPLLVLLFALTLAACGTAGAPGGSAPSAQNTATATPAPTATSTMNGASSSQIKTANATVNGVSVTLLTDAQGRTLYYLTQDSATRITCSGGCAQTWPPLLQATGNPVSATKLPGTLSTFNGPNGRQVLYNGHPLYTYAGDSGPGQTHGEGVGGVWFVATTDLAAQGAATASPTGNGY